MSNRLFVTWGVKLKYNGYDNETSYTAAAFKCRLGPGLVSLIVLFHGIFIIVLTLAEQLVVHHHRIHITDLSLDITLAIGLTVIYLSALLSRRKRTGLIATAIAYTFYLGANIEGLSDVATGHHNLSLRIIVRAVILPVVILLLLYINGINLLLEVIARALQSAIVVSIILLAVTFVYGTVGFHILRPERLSPAAVSPSSHALYGRPI